MSCLPSLVFRKIALLLAAAWLGGCVTPPPPASLSKAEAIINTPRPLVIAHRGYSAIAPENTLEAFRLAMVAGADLVELDYHHSQDGIPVVIHDAELDRTTDATNKWPERKITVRSRSLAELSQLDAGRRFHPRFAGQRLPRLDAAVELIQSNSITLIERKAGDAQTCVRLLQNRRWINEVVVQAFDWAFLRDFHALEPRQILGALGPPASRGGRRLTEPEKVLTAEWVEEAHQAGARIIVWNRWIDPAATASARQHRMKVWVYTIDEPALAHRLLDLGVDGLITNNPGLIWKTLAERRGK